MPTIRLQTVLAAPPEECFELSLSVDAHRESMSRSKEQIVGGVATGSMRRGETVTWRARHFGIPFRMTSQISEYEWSRRFVDEQVSGPFRRWWHEHTFEPVPDGTLMTDVVELVSPVGPLGAVVDRLFLRRYMTRLLVDRNEWLRSALAASSGGTPPGR